MASIAEKRAFVVCICFVLLITQNWRVLAFLLLIAVLFQYMRIQNHDTILEQLKDLVPAVGTPHYVDSYQMLGRLKGRYPEKDIKRAQNRVIKNMLYNLPLPDDAVDTWAAQVKGMDTSLE